jgi:uracil-DNA glycosylase
MAILTTDLDALLGEIRLCRACAGELPHTPRPVVMVRPQTKILICGQAPGRRVHESGLPFTDPSGDRLRDWMGVSSEQFYGDPRIGVAAMAFCYPGTSPKGGDYPPPPRCAQLWRARLMEQLQPELVLLVGSYAQNWTLGRRNGASLSQTVANWRSFVPNALPLPHPSWRNTGWLRANPWFNEEIVPWLRQRVSAILGS